MYLLYGWSLQRFPSVKEEVLIFRQRVETEVEVQRRLICTILCLYLPSDPMVGETSMQPCVGQLFLLPPLCHRS